MTAELPLVSRLQEIKSKDHCSEVFKLKE